jgi:hypothetical protein
MLVDAVEWRVVRGLKGKQRPSRVRVFHHLRHEQSIRQVVLRPFISGSGESNRSVS